MNIAAIDIGTNTIRLLIGSFENSHLKRIHADRAVTRLGRDLLKTGLLQEDVIQKSILALHDFRNICDTHNVQKITAVGTSALREALNSQDFLNRVKKETGIAIEIIPGEKEAELTVKGIFSDNSKFNIHDSTFFIVDIGGGSTEWIVSKGQGSGVKGQEHSKFLRMGSLPLGAVKLYETFIKHDPPAPDELLKTGDYISKCLHNTFNASLLTLKPSPSLIATGGTPATLASIDMGLESYDGDKVHMHAISNLNIHRIFENMLSMPIGKRRQIQGIEPERADIIIPGTLILMAIIKSLNAMDVLISDYGLLEGLLYSN